MLRMHGANVVVTVILAASIALVSCTAPTPASPTTAPASAQPPAPSAAVAPTQPAKAPATPAPTGPSGQMTVALATFGNETFDPAAASGTTTLGLLTPVFEFLVTTDPSEKVSSGIAEKWEIAPDGLSWTFHLRKGVTFHDGTPVTAKDVKFSLERFAAKEAFLAYIRDSQERVEAVDEYTVRVYTKGVQPNYWRYVGSVAGQQGMIIPKDYFEKVGKDAFIRNPIGTGPFKLVSYARGDNVVYEALDKHYRQTASFKKLNVVSMPEEATRVASLKTGAVDAAEIGIDSTPALESAGLRVAELAGTQTVLNFFGAYDARAKGLPVSDVRVREALSLAINREELGKSFFYGKLQPPTPPTMWQEQPGIDASYWKTEAAKAYRYDQQKALQLLKDAGYPNGFNIKLYSYTIAGGDYLPRLALVVQGYWQKIGVKAEIVPIDYSVYSSWRRGGPNKGPVDALVGNAALHTGNGNFIPAKALQPFFGSSGSVDLLQKGVPEIDGLINGALVEPDAIKSSSMMAKAIRLAMDARLMEVIGTVPAMVGLGPRVDMAFPSIAMSISTYAETAKPRK